MNSLQLVLEKQAVDFGGRLTGNVWGLEFPVGQNLALVGFNQQNALLTSTDPVPLWMLAKIERLEIERVVKFLHLQKLAKPKTTNFDSVL